MSRRDQTPWLIELEKCASTNSWALEHVEALAHGACVWTKKQTHGRGRDGAKWQSPPGVLTATFVLDSNEAIDAVRLGLAAGLAVCHAVEDLVPTLSVRVKWPNDCVIADKKVAGILCERAARQARQKIVVGIGLNLTAQWKGGLKGATLPPASLSDFAKKVPSTLDVLPLLRKYLIEAAGLLQARNWSPLVEALRERDWLYERTIRVESAGEDIEGTAAGIDEQGRLLLRTKTGTKAFASAHIRAHLAKAISSRHSPT